MLWTHFLMIITNITNTAHYNKITTITGNNSIKIKIAYLLNIYDFKWADILFEQYCDKYSFNTSEYEKYKAWILRNYFTNKYNLRFEFDNEQLGAIASIHKNTLITARAWSWKTQVLAWKVAYLVDWEKLNNDEILVLSFNKKAANELNKRINNFWYISKIQNKKMLEFENSLTFHALAYKILWNDNKSKILMDSDKIMNPKTWVEYEKKTNKLTLFVQSCFLKIYEWNIKKIMEEKLRSHLSYFKSSWYLDDPIKYYSYRINNENLSLNWDYIRSLWEKLIIDAIFEYWPTKIEYEPLYYIGNEWEKFLSKPDVKCTFEGLSKYIIIEHWWFDENDNFNKFPIWKSISWKDYCELKNKKIDYWKSEEKKGNCYFVQTSVKDINYSNPEAFKRAVINKISNILEQEWIKIKKLDFDAIIFELRQNERRVFPFTKLLKNFINKSQQKHFSSNEIEEKINMVKDEEERAFYIIANEVYKKYQTEKTELGFTDFNEILKKSNDKILSFKWNLNIKIHKHSINLTKIKYLIIDEYQDFSNLFYLLIESIFKFNPQCKLFVVWDNWQSINTFAWSELKYFIDFRKEYYNEKSTEKKISTNYRSKQKIVETWNSLMKYTNEQNAVWHSPVNDWWAECILINISNHWAIDDEKISNVFKTKDNKNNLEKSKHVFQKIIGIIQENKWKSVMFLSRNNIVFDYTLIEWKEKLCKYYALLLKVDSSINRNNFNTKLNWNTLLSYNKLLDFVDNRIDFITTHKSKWKEADIVIILDISEKKFPSKESNINKNAKYERIFGITPSTILDDERRLFYVAITRAKEKIYILTEENTASWLFHELKY